MTPDELNDSYRSIDIKRWQKTDWVLGYEVRLSATPKLQLDICKELAGIYPKWFKFSSWAPGCGCYIIPVLPSMIEFQVHTRSMLNGKKGFDLKGLVKDVPLNFKSWVYNNQDINPVPKFVKDNFINGDIKLGLKTPFKERLLVHLNYLPLESITDKETQEINDITFSQVRKIEKHLKGLECSQHPTITSSLIVTPTKDRNLQFDENFCCADFWYKVIDRLKMLL